MKKYTGDVELRGNLDVLSDKPLDSRLVVQNKSDLYTMDSRYAYVGMPVMCIAETCIYTLIDKANISSGIGWKKISGDSDIKQVVMEEEDYEELENKDRDTLYFIYEPEDESSWTFGDEFPIILT